MHIYIWDYGDHQLRLKCAQVRHHSPAGTFARVPGRCLRWSPTPPGPRWSPANRYILIEVLHLYRCVTHTHTLPWAGWWRGRWGEDEDEGGVKVKWPWRWDEELLNQNAKRERKRGRRGHQHTHLARSGQTLKGQGKRKAEGRRTRNKTSGGGEGRKRLNQPDTAKTYKHLSTRRSQPTWGGKNAWDRGPMGISWWNHKKLKQDSVPKT